VSTLYVWCAIVGGAVLVFQLAAGLMGFHHDLASGGHDADHGGDGAEGLNLLGIRALAAGVAFFGLAGLAARPLGSFLSVVSAVVAGVAATAGVAALVRALGRLESDRTLSLGSAVGQTGTVYLSIPGKRSGTGKIHVVVHDRLVECVAVTAEDALPTGTSILVIDLEDNDTVVVVRNPILLNEVSNVVA